MINKIKNWFINIWEWIKEKKIRILTGLVAVVSFVLTAVALDWRKTGKLGKWLAIPVSIALMLFGTSSLFYSITEELPTFAADTGWKNPSATGDNYNDAKNPANAYTSDNSRVGWRDLDEQDYYNFSFGVPAGATINGIEVSVEARYWFMVDFEGGFKLSYNGGTNWTAQKNEDWTTTTDTYKSMGGSTDTWGRSWSSSEFSDSNFRVYVIQRGGPGGPVDVDHVDHIRAKVFYTEGAAERRIIITQ